MLKKKQTLKEQIEQINDREKSKESAGEKQSKLEIKNRLKMESKSVTKT